MSLALLLAIALLLLLLACGALLCVLALMRVLARRPPLSTGPRAPLPLTVTVAAAKTGDLVLFRWYYVDVLHLTMSKYTHVGMVVRNPTTGEPFVLEAHNVGDTRQHGVYDAGIYLYPLAARIQKYEGEVHVWRLSAPLPARAIARLHAQLPVYLSWPFYPRYRQHYLRTCLAGGLLGSEPRAPPAVFCSEFVATVLRDIGLLQPGARGATLDCVTPESVTRLPLVPPYKYAPPAAHAV